MVVLQRLRLAPLTISIQNVDKCQFYKRIPIPDIYLCLGWRMFWNQKYACNHVAFYTITDTWIENVNLSKTDTLTYAHLLLKIRRMSLLLLKRNAPKQNKNRIEASISITLTHIVTIQVKLRLGKHSKYETKGNCECFLFRGVQSPNNICTLLPIQIAGIMMFLWKRIPDTGDLGTVS